jgi:hypothetical protein
MYKENKIEVEMPEELKAILASLEYEEDGWLVGKNYLFLENELHVDFILHLGDQDSTTQQWQMIIEGYKTSMICPDRSGKYFQFYDDHFLLFEFHDVHTELYIKNGSKNAEALFGDLYLNHQKYFGNFLPLGHTLGASYAMICSHGDNFGLFGRGPKKILDVYFDCLKRAGTEPYFVAQYGPKVEDLDLKLLIIGGCYFVGKAFSFTKVE